MDFSVLVKISKLHVSFWYQSGAAVCAPLVIKGSNEVGLYFYIDGNDFLFGNAARERFFYNDPNAFGNYFEIIKEPGRHFTIYGNQKPVKLLLYYGIEQCLSYFINSVLYKSDSIESYRQHFPLRFIFDADIEDKEKLLVVSLFREAGYENIQTLDLNTALLQVVLSEGLISQHSPILLLWGINNVLYFELYNAAFDAPVAVAKLEGHGADPVARMLAEMIVEDVITRNAFLSVNKEKETAHLLSFASSLLESSKHFITGEAALIDGQKYYFKVRESTLNERALYYSSDAAIFNVIDELLRSCKGDEAKIQIILANKEIDTPFFSKKLLKRYAAVKSISPLHFHAAIEIMFQKKTARPAAPPAPVKKSVVPKPSLPNASREPPVAPPAPPALPKPSKPPPPPSPNKKN